MTSVISIFSEAEILSAAQSVSLVTRRFKIQDVRKKLLCDAGYGKRYYITTDQRRSKITGAKVSATLRAHPDLFGVHYAPNGRIRSFYRTGEVA